MCEITPISLPENLKNEIEILKSKLNYDDNKNEFEEFYKNCKNINELELLLVRYRHLLPELYDPLTYGLKVYEPLNRPICIGYLLNEDKIFYNELDSVICNYLRNEGALVIQFKVEDFILKSSKNGVDIYIKDELCKFDGFMSYGYRKKTNMDVYFYIVKIMQENGVVCLHDYKIDLIVNNKLLQSICFAKANLPIPDTYETFNLKATQNLLDNLDKNLLPCVLKPLDDYGGDGLLRYNDKFNLISKLNRSFWKGKHMLLQSLIPDSYGRSIRVLCFNGKAFAIAQYQDESGSFTSNFCYGDKFRLISFMDHPRYDIYASIAENATKSIGNVLIAGVDLLDSELKGVVVLEVNGWPDIFDIWFETNKCGFKQLASCFIYKIMDSIQLNQQNDA